MEYFHRLKIRKCLVLDTFAMRKLELTFIGLFIKLSLRVIRRRRIVSRSEFRNEFLENVWFSIQPMLCIAHSNRHFIEILVSSSVSLRVIRHRRIVSRSGLRNVLLENV